MIKNRGFKTLNDTWHTWHTRHILRAVQNSKRWRLRLHGAEITARARGDYGFAHRRFCHTDDTDSTDFLWLADGAENAYIFFVKNNENNWQNVWWFQKLFVPLHRWNERGEQKKGGGHPEGKSQIFARALLACYQRDARNLKSKAGGNHPV